MAVKLEKVWEFILKCISSQVRRSDLLLCIALRCKLWLTDYGVYLTIVMQD